MKAKRLHTSIPIWPKMILVTGQLQRERERWIVYPEEIYLWGLFSINVPTQYGAESEKKG